MGYDRQRSPFGTRLFLTCYCLFLLLNILLYANNNYRVKLYKTKFQQEMETIFLCFFSLLLFSISFYGLWFAKILILCLIALLYSILFGTTFISIIIIITNISSMNISILKTSHYFAHNYIWLIKSSTHNLSIINLSFSFILNIFALWGICHLCSCIEHRHESWPYRKRTPRTSQTAVL